MSQTQGDAESAGMIGGSPSVELSANRTSLSFERTRMSADRTLMSIVRTALSLISFGFTIYQVFNQAAVARILPDAFGTARRVGFALLLLGILTLIMGIWSHATFGRKLNARRDRLFGQGLLHTDIHYHATPTFIVATVLLLIGLAAAGSITFRLAL